MGYMVVYSMVNNAQLEAYPIVIKEFIEESQLI